MKSPAGSLRPLKVNLQEACQDLQSQLNQSVMEFPEAIRRAGARYFGETEHRKCALCDVSGLHNLLFVARQLRFDAETKASLWAWAAASSPAPSANARRPGRAA